MMKQAKIGDMRHRITFQSEVKAADGYKGHVVTWSNDFTVWASVEPISGREYFYAHQIKAEITHRIKIRYDKRVTSKMRIDFGGRYLKIESVLDIKERREILEILCREVKE